MKIKKMIKHKEKYCSLLIEDDKIKFWIDCSIIDGYGNHENYKTDDLYLDWEYNQYIFNLENENDLKMKEYQENGENAENIQYLLDEYNDKLISLMQDKGAKKW